MKQMLLVFEQLVFLDPVDDEAWRAYLFKKLEPVEDQRFTRYREVYNVLPTLFKQGAIRRIDPAACSHLEDSLTSAAIVSDLMDPFWAEVSSKPQTFNMPHRSLAPDGTPTWQVFQQKLPHAFLTALHHEPELNKHLVIKGTEHQSWTLTYSAGSAVALNVHLATAEEFNLAPVTDSEMHHQLLLIKLARNLAKPDKSHPISHDVARQLSNRIAVSLLSQILPQEALMAIPFDDILRFREETRVMRKHLINELNSRISLLTRVPTPDEFSHAAREVQNSLQTELRQYQAEFGATRDKIWPSLVASLNTSSATGSLAAIAMTYIGGPGYALAASVLAASLTTLKGFLDIRAEQNKLKASVSPAVSYLSRVSGAFT